MSLELEEYCKYIETPAPFENHHAKYSAYRDDKALQSIDSWVRTDLQASENRPLVITGPSLSGKKTLLVQWAARHRSLNNEDIVLMEFAVTGNGKFAEALYRILSSLRVQSIEIQERLQINQKVETNEEKLRRFFPYWMEVCSKALQKKNLEEGKSRARRIILVICGVDSFTNENGEPLLPGYWLPETFPEGIKLLVSANERAPTPNFFKRSQRIVLEEKRIAEIKTKLLTKSSQPLQKLLMESKVSLPYCRIILQLFSPQNPFYDTLQEFELTKLKSFTLEELCISIIEFWQDKLLKKRSIEEIFKILTFSKKGLTAGEVCFLAGLRPAEFKKFVCVFDGLVESHDSVWYVSTQSVRDCLLKLLKMDAHKQSLYHLHMAKALRQLPQSLRKLEEEIYHLFQSGSLPELKETISQVQNFLLLFNWHTKYQLCHYWRQLEVKHAFDPVFQYNRSLTTFEMHYYPSEENLFRLLLQFSRFFIEYADFEMYNTPSFRHPLIKGDQEELKELHVLEEFRTMGMLMERQIKHANEKPKEQNPSEMFRSSLAKTLTNASKESNLLIQNRINQIVQDLANKRPLRLKEPKAEKDRYVYLPENREWVETVSIDIPANRIKFQEHYFKQLEDYFVETHVKEGSIRHAGSVEPTEGKDIPPAKLCTGNRLLSYSQFEEEKYYLSLQEPKYYYYKQWLWIQFPWISMSLNEDYSKLIRKCIKSSTQYIEVAEEKELTTKAALLSMEANQRKCQTMNKGVYKLDRMPSRELKPLPPTEDNRGREARQKTQEPKLTERTANRENSFQLDHELERYKAVKRSDPVTKRAHTNQNTFLTGIACGDTEVRQPLPTIRVQRNSKTLKEDPLDLKRAYNALCYENARLEKKIMELKMLESTFEQTGSQKEEEELTEQLKKATKKGNDLRQSLAKTLIHQEKLRTIIDICHDNKVFNSEAVGPLNNFVANLKVMIECGKNDIKKFKDAARANEKELKHEMQVLVEQLNRIERHHLRISSIESQPSCAGRLSERPDPNQMLIEAHETFRKSEFDKSASFKTVAKSQLMETVEAFESCYGELSLTNPKILEICAAIEKKKEQEQRSIELELERDTLLKRLAELEQRTNEHSTTAIAQEQEGKDTQHELQYLDDLRMQLEAVRQKKASLQIFLSSVQQRMSAGSQTVQS